MAIAKFTIEMAAELGQLRKDVANINQIVSQMGGTLAKAYGPGAAALASLGEAHTRMADQAKLSALAQQKSARQVQYQNIQLANQLQDLAIQVAGGQNPLLALAQQGSQLTAVYGGLRPAMAALAGLLTPVNLAIGGVAVAAGGLVYALAKGSSQSAEFSRSIALTGNAAGLTASSFEDMVRRVSTSADLGTGKVREMAQALVSTGRFTPGNIEQATRNAALMAQITGKSAQDVAQDYVRMADAPAQYAASANKSLHFLSDAELQHIRQLEATGHRQEAVYEVLRLQARRFSSDTAGNLSRLEKVLKDVGEGWDKMWDSAFGSGRELTTDQRVEQAMASLERAKLYAKDGSTNEIGPYGGRRSKADGVAQAQEQLRQALSKQGAELRLADYQARKAAEDEAKDEARALEERLRGSRLAIAAAKDAYSVKIKTLDADAAIYALETRLALGLDTSPQTQAIIRQAIAKQELIKLGEQEVKLQGDLKRAAASVIDTKPETALAAQQQKVQIETQLLDIGAQRVRVEAQLRAEQNRIAQAEFDDVERWVDKLAGMEAVSREYEFQRGIIGATTIEAQRLADVRAIEARYLNEVSELERRRDIDAYTRAQRLTELEDAKARQLDAYAKLHAERYRQIYDAEAGVSMAVREYAVRVAQAGDRAREATDNILRSMEDGLVRFVATGKASFKDFADTIIQELVRVRIAAPLVKELSGGDWLGKLLGGGGSGANAPGGSKFGADLGYETHANGGAFGAAGKIHAFAKGGAFTNAVYNSPTLFKFAKGSRFGVMGEAGPEAVMPLKRDSQGRLGVVAQAMHGGPVGDMAFRPNIIIQVNNESGGKVGVTAAGYDAGGDFRLDVAVTKMQDALADNVAAGSGSLYHAIGSRFAKSPSY